MGDYRYCMTCRLKYKAVGTEQKCPKCGGVLADTPTGARNTPPPAEMPKPEPVKVEPVVASSGPTESVDSFSCTATDVMLCLLHNILTGIPVVGLLWCGFSALKNPLKGRVSKGTIMAGLIANIISLIIVVTFTFILK